MTQPEGDKSRRVREECCALQKKAVIKNLEFPVAFESTFEGVMAAASGVSCGSKKKGLAKNKYPQVDTLWVPKFHCKPPPNYSPPHRAAHSKAKVLCRVPFHPNPNNL